jgi:cell division protein FtsB
MMLHRPLNLVLIALLLVLQGQLWLGRGSIPDVMRLRQQLKEQKQQNAAAQLANDRLSAELHDLKDGLEMVEERARSEIGMVKPNEIFVQIAK